MIISEGTFTRSSTPRASSPLSHSIQSGETLGTGSQHIVDVPSNLRDMEHMRPALHTRASVSDVDPMGDMDRGGYKSGPRHSLDDTHFATRTVWNTMSTTKYSLVDLDKPLPPLPEYDKMSLADADARLQTDGRLQISFNRRFTRRFPDLYGESVQEPGIDSTGFKDAPQMNVNIMIVGSRGDVQPYLAHGKKLQEYGHTVRLSTHETFRELVKGAGLRFFSIGGDPHELMSYMVRNPGLIPGFESLKNRDIRKKQSMVGEILEGCYLSCFAPDAEQDGGALFVADAIILNPPTFAHIHCAEALGIPLLLSFTMPWCATAAFPHLLINFKHGPKDEPRLVNYYSYGLVDIMTWQGLGRTISKFQIKRLGLSYLNTQSAVGMIERCAIPWTYCLSPALVSKPADWMDNVDVVGFYFLDSAKEYTPPKDLEDFLAAGEPPIYIGFGSIVLENPEQITQSVLEAISLCGVRALVSPGWGGLDKALIDSAGSNIFTLGNVPHDWLFERVSAVCHHGGAGTTAIGLRCGKLTIIVPFFGDQVARRGAGPPPIYPKQLTAESLATAIRIALSSRAKEAAMVVGTVIKEESESLPGDTWRAGSSWVLGVQLSEAVTNLFFKPLAGAMAAVSLPLEGTTKDVQALFHKKTTTQQHATRYMEGLVEAGKAAQSERDAVIKTFEEYNIWRSVDKKGKGREIFEETLAVLKRG
ncbi:glycosyltransferase family 1 protein [Ceratobasidium sp. AG-Ba]|nr:glycosyltransferase family 1 protein [Ceratobasidium sp. AG-Ba]